MKIGREYIYAATSILCWGTVATASKIIMNQMDAMYALAFSFLTATIFLFLYNLKCGHLSKLRRLSARTALRMIIVGSLGVLFYNLFLLLGTALLPAQEAFVINYLWPALIIIFSCLLLKESMTIGKFAAVLFSFLGIIVVTTNGNFHNLLGGSLMGILYSLMAALCYGLYCTLNKREDYDKNISVFLSYASGTVIAFLWILIRGTCRIPSMTESVGLIWNGIICNALPYLTWALALDMGNTAVIANLAYLTPFVSLLATHFILDEPVTVYSVAGLLLIVLGIVIQVLMQKTPTRRQKA
ncbi:MAG: DMT family transporter [Lachnospiraceae bacterium]